MVVPTLTMNNGKQIPVIGLGTWQAPDEEVQQSIKYALDVGYRLIDTALLYGNEAGVGAAVRDRIDKGLINRDDVTVCSKLWNTHHSVDDVVPTCRQSLKNLGLDYIDLYLVHWPFGLKSKQPPSIPQQFDSFDLTSIEDTWAEMEKCVELGLVKSIGVSNFNSSQVQRVLDCASIKPVVNQVECHMMLNQKPLIEFCKNVGVIVEGYSPFGSPSRPNVPAEAVNIFQIPEILQLAAKYGKTSGQIILRYLLQLGIVVLPKSVNPQRIKQNLEVFDFELSPDDVALLSPLDCHQRIFPYVIAKDHPDYPFPEEEPSSNTSQGTMQL